MLRKIHQTVWIVLAIATCPLLASASAYRGQVTFGGEPVPGATVTVTQGEKKFSVVTDQGGLYSFPELSDGPSQVDVQMACFATIDTNIIIVPQMPAARWEMTLLPEDKMMALSKLAPSVLPTLKASTSAAKPTAAPSEAADIPKPAEEANQQFSDGFLINGSTNNAATSKFSLDQAFGNRRSNSKGLYNGGFAAIIDNSALDARPFSLSGLEAPKPAYNRITLGLTLGGPLKIPHLMPHGPTFFVGYQWTRDRTNVTEAGLVPTDTQRTGDLAGLLNSLGQPITIYDPLTGLPFANNNVPVSPQAAALLRLYPLPNIAGNPLYNYQVPVLNSSHQDALQSRLDKTLGRKDQVYGSFAFQSTRASRANLFSFNDTTDTLGINSKINWSHRFSQHLYLYAAYSFSRLRTNLVPYFENRENVSAGAGIEGNDQDPANWGPPSLVFSSGIAGLTDGTSSFNRARTDGVSGSVAFYHGRHYASIGGDFRRQQYNDFFQQQPRGEFGFTGAATQGSSTNTTTDGSDLADFLLGIPDTSTIAFGNPDKYLRESVYDVYLNDDWRVRSDLTVNVGVRWEYGAPITEIHGRLVNLDVAPGPSSSFTAVSPVSGSDPVGPLTGIHYPSSLIRPDKLGFEPRVGVSWRPIPASTVVVRAGYGIYRDTSIYKTSALSLAQQSPLSKSLSVENTAGCPLTLANGFLPCSSTTENSFAVDPNFRVGYAQTWQLAVQRDLPFALQFTATYLGVKGTRGVQQFLPNTYAIGATNPCLNCPLGFEYQTSGGDSSRQSGLLQLRRRLRNGFTASLLYTYSKSIDDDAFVGGQGHVTSSASGGSSESSSTGTSTQNSAQANPSVAQNWLALRAERSLSSFDQRNLLNLQLQYTSGEGLNGGTLMAGWPGRLLKEWTLLTQISAGSGLPETPVYLAAVPGTGFTDTIRPNPTGAPLYLTRSQSHLNAAAYAAPQPGQWGTAGRYSITGPDQFNLDSSIARTFRPNQHFYLDARIDAMNLLNHVVFAGWNATVNSTQFGVPLSANAMRSLEATFRVRF